MENPMRYSHFTYLTEIVVWVSGDLKTFGWAPKGMKPNQTPFASKAEAEKAARRAVKSAVKIVNGRRTLDLTGLCS
jgi:hypothetical protein